MKNPVLFRQVGKMTLGNNCLKKKKNSTSVVKIVLANAVSLLCKIPICPSGQTCWDLSLFKWFKF